VAGSGGCAAFSLYAEGLLKGFEQLTAMAGRVVRSLQMMKKLQVTTTTKQQQHQ
jgi:hypothetical protein